MLSLRNNFKDGRKTADTTAGLGGVLERMLPVAQDGEAVSSCSLIGFPAYSSGEIVASKLRSYVPGHAHAAFDGRPARPITQSRAKRLLDCALAAMALLLILPLFLVLSVLIRLDGGPVFFLHTRLGAGGRPFKCLKFRTMVANGKEVLQALLETDAAAAAEWAATQKLRRDPRVTRVGRFLRATSLDEVPQLINVLRDEMSLVGPRPIVSDEIIRYGHDIQYYFAARPGITGLWQVSGRSNTTYEQRVKLDVSYVRGWSVTKDLAILFKTIPAVLFQKGAH